MFLALCLLAFSGCGRLVAGSEEIYRGTVTDLGMSVVAEGDRCGRAYLILVSDDNTATCFWLRKGFAHSAKIGDRVIVESAVETWTNLLTATSVTVE